MFGPPFYGGIPWSEACPSIHPSDLSGLLLVVLRWCLTFYKINLSWYCTIHVILNKVTWPFRSATRFGHSHKLYDYDSVFLFWVYFVFFNSPKASSCTGLLTFTHGLGGKDAMAFSPPALSEGKSALGSTMMSPKGYHFSYSTTHVTLQDFIGFFCLCKFVFVILFSVVT